MSDFLSTINSAVGSSPAPSAPTTPTDNGVMNVLIKGNASSAPTVAPVFDPNAAYGTPPKLLDNLQQTESSGDPHAVNPKTGAMGAYQFLPSTVAMLNKQGVKFDPFNPGQARAAADFYLQHLAQANGGDLIKAVAEYGGFKNQDPAAYVGKVMNGVNAPSQDTTPANDPNAFNAGSLLSAVNQFNAGGNKALSPPPVSPETAAAGIGNVPANLDDVRSGIAGGAAHLLTGIGSSIIGGYQGLAKLATGGSSADAAQAVTQYEQAHTYQGEPGKGSGTAVALLDSPYNPMNYPGEIANKGGDVANQLALKEGASPGTAAAIGAGTGAVLNLGSMLLGGKGGKAAEARAALKSASPVTSSLDALRPVQVEQQAQNFVPTTPDLPAYMRKGQPVPEVQQQASAAQAATPSGSNSTPPSSTAAASPTESENVIQQMAKQAGRGANTTAVGRHAEAASLPVPVELTAGQATGDPRLISLEQNNRGKFPALATRFNQQGNAIAQNLSAIRDKVAPDVATTGVANDQALVDSYKKVDSPIRQDITNKYQALADANGGDMPLSGKDFVSAADTALAADDSGYFLPAEVKNLLASYRDGENALTFNKFETLRTVLGQAQRAATDGNASHAIGVVRNTLESLPMSEGTAALKPLADAARIAAKARFDKLATDPAYKAAVNDGVPIGEPSPVADQFIRKYVINGKTANVGNMVSNLSPDPMARQIIGAGVVDHLRSASGLDTRTGAGNVSQAALNKAITGLDQKTPLVFDPTTAKTVQTLGNVARYTQEQPRGSFVNNSNTTVAAHAMDFAKSAAEGALNVKAGGVPVGSLIRRGLENRSTSKMLNRSLKPGAGIKISDFPR